MTASVCFPAWWWIDEPQTRFLTGSYASKLAIRDAVKTRKLIQSRWYQDNWGDSFSFSKDQNEKGRYENDHMGYRIATSVNGSATGEGGDVLMLDDPHKPDEVHSDLVREGVIEWWKEVWSSRHNDMKTGIEIIIMQRLHERDITGYILAEIGGYEHLMIPMEYSEDRHCKTFIIGWEDPRIFEGQLMCPERFGEEEVIELKKKLGEFATSGQLQQSPAPTEGGIIKKYWLRFWYPSDVREIPAPYMVRKPDGTFHECIQIEKPESFDEQFQSWDMAFKDKVDSAFVCGQVWGQLLIDCFLLYQIRDKLDLPKTCQAVILLSEMFPETYTKWVEDKANGPAVMQTLQHNVTGLDPVEPKGGKIARCHAMAPAVKSGNVYLPHPSLFPWVHELIAEVAMFPNGAYADQVDTMTQAVNKMTEIVADPNVRGFN